MLFQALPEFVHIYEVGPRDGLQNESSILSTDRKVAFIEGLVNAGIRHVEITSFVDPRWIPGLADHNEVARRIHRQPDVHYSALVPNMRGLENAMQAGMKEVAVFMAATQSHNRKNINKSTEQALETYRGVIQTARQQGLRVRGYVSCVYGCPYEGQVPVEQVIEVCQALLDMGVYQLSLGDTVGIGTPKQVSYILQTLFRHGFAKDQLAVHFHDTRGTALANILVALQLGIATVDSAAGGLGGCPYAPGASGNVATEDVVYMLHGMGIETGIDLQKLVRVSAQLVGPLAHELPSKYLKAYLGHCARTGQS